MQCKVIFIRHGKTKANLEHRYLGSTEQTLCMQGRKELEEIETLVPELDYLYTSPLIRCIQSCEILYPKHIYCIVERFREIDFGNFEMKNYVELNGNPQYQKWLDSNGTIAFPNGESRQNFIERTYKGFQQVLYEVEEKIKTENKDCFCPTIGIIAHGGTMMAIADKLMDGAYFSYQCKNGEGYAFSVERKKHKIKLLDTIEPLTWLDRSGI